LVSMSKNVEQGYGESEDDADDADSIEYADPALNYLIFTVRSLGS
jgi:hypothetical protein